MSAVWLCTSCSAHHQCNELACRRCAAPRTRTRASALVRRSADTVPLLLHLPPVDFPYSRTHRKSGAVRPWLAPAMMLAFGLSIAVGWDSIVRRFDAARALGGGHEMAERARRTELGEAAERLGALVAEREAAEQPPEWSATVRSLEERYRLDGNVSNAALGPLEVSLRVAWLELVSLPPRGVAPAEVTGRLETAKVELSRVTEDLSNAR